MQFKSLKINDLFQLKEDLIMPERPHNFVTERKFPKEIIWHKNSEFTFIGLGDNNEDGGYFYEDDLMEAEVVLKGYQLYIEMLELETETDKKITLAVYKERSERQIAELILAAKKIFTSHWLSFSNSYLSDTAIFRFSSLC